MKLVRTRSWAQIDLYLAREDRPTAYSIHTDSSSIALDCLVPLIWPTRISNFATGRDTGINAFLVSHPAVATSCEAGRDTMPTWVP